MLDKRAYSPEKIVPPHPLPFVSRKALRRVKNPLPAPGTCRYCGPNTPVSLVSNADIYGREYGDWPYMYLCDNCEAYVGLHPNTDIPLGPLADKDLRGARKHHKADFLELQRLCGWRRKEAYAWLARKMNIPIEECHFGWFEIEQCEQAGKIARLAMMSGKGGTQHAQE